MLTKDDLADIFIAGLAPAKPAAAAVSLWNPLGPTGRVFLSEHDVKKRLTPGGVRLTIPESAILSPLVTDWLILKGIEIVKE